ncbi:MAG: dihydroneopterin aldolase [Flavobacteriales bacterium]|jgi:dihydroneopterin aldolase|nr:dihydroneopterin aldolase [Flavobacteriales bacterium]|tara:strand:+ start:152 stop:511 length:360 start_codon:yes stop_codon:yes gene_type:complete
MGRILIRDLATYSYHGCFEEENKIGANYKLNIWVDGDFSKAESTDSLIDTIDYVELADLAAKEMASPSRLIEHVADRILSKILSRWSQITLAGLTIIKVSPPMNEFVKSVEYTIEKRQA